MTPDDRTVKERYVSDLRADLARIAAERDRLRAALEEVRVTVGLGFPDIVQANTALSKIDGIARKALRGTTP